MQEFLKEWGPAVITAVAVLVIVAVISLLKGSLQTMFENLLNTVQNSSTKIVDENAGVKTETQAPTPETPTTK